MPAALGCDDDNAGADTWEERLREAIGPGGYDPCMRRSLQACLLLEARRRLKPHLSSLRPFQRKFALLDQARALLAGLTFVPDHLKAPVLFRTLTSREPLPFDVAAARAQAGEKELVALAGQVRPFVAEAATHGEACDRLARELFDRLQHNGNGAATMPEHWEHTHKHHMLAFRIYYRFDEPDPTFPKPTLAKELAYPLDKATYRNAGMVQQAQARSLPQAPHPHTGPMVTYSGAAAAALPPGLLSGPAPAAFGPGAAAVASPDPSAAAPAADGSAGAARRRLLAEVREHLDLLKEFEGAVPPQELAERKRQLFLALPGAPPAAAGKKPRF